MQQIRIVCSACGNSEYSKYISAEKTIKKFFDNHRIEGKLYCDKCLPKIREEILLRWAKSIKEYCKQKEDEGCESCIFLKRKFCAFDCGASVWEI